MSSHHHHLDEQMGGGHVVRDIRIEDLARRWHGIAVALGGERDATPWDELPADRRDDHVMVMAAAIVGDLVVPPAIDVEPEVLERFHAFWGDVVSPGGVFDVRQAMRELHDYAGMLEQVPKVFDHVTGGRVSKPNTLAEGVIAAHDEHCPRFTRAGTEAVHDLIERAMDEGRNVQPADEDWTDDQAHAVEVFALRLMAALDD